MAAKHLLQHNWALGQHRDSAYWRANEGRIGLSPACKLRKTLAETLPSRPWTNQARVLPECYATAAASRICRVLTNVFWRWERGLRQKPSSRQATPRSQPRIAIRPFHS